MNISGVLIHTRPGEATAVRHNLSSLTGVEVHANQNNRLVVTVESNTTNTLADRVMQFQDLPDILSVAVVYHHSEDCDESHSLETSL